jgi:hypothetical protein
MTKQSRKNAGALKNDFVAAKRSFASDENRAELTLCSYKNMGFSAVSY